MGKGWARATATAGLAVFLASGAALAAEETPATGVEMTPRRGFFAQTDLGAFFTLGGKDHYSNVQTYLQVDLGVDIGEHVELALDLGLGASNANCFAAGSATDGSCTAADSFSMATADLSVAYLIPVAWHLYLAPRLMGGYSALDPAPLGTAVKTQHTLNAGAGFGVEYVTRFDHFSIGADVSFRYVFGPGIPAIAVFPRAKYTF